MSEFKKANKKKYLKYFTNRFVFLVLFALLQIGFFIATALWLNESSRYISYALHLITAIVVLYILSRRGDPSFKLALVVPIMVFPIFGGLFYVFIRGQSSSLLFRKKTERVLKETDSLLKQEKTAEMRFALHHPSHRLQMRYLIDRGGFPIYDGSESKYYPLADDCFTELVEKLKEAKSFIFVEYFIIQEGVMWDTVLDILVQKASEGVDVRVLYDGLGTIKTLPGKYEKKLRKLGIRCSVFNPYIPILSDIQNNRDHRKILVIDGEYAFTGGFNMADEYINVYDRFGHWKDSAIMVRGEAVRSFTVLFLQMWYLYNKKDKDADIERFLRSPSVEGEGFVHPYGDSPLDNERVGHNVYRNIINRTDRYVYIMTPYLILDNEMMNTLSLAAESGIDVRIITPHNADKWYVHVLTRSYYRELIEAGVRIFEYTPGFIHSKQFVSDDVVAAVGTVNLDYRSLFLHYECASLLYDCKAVTDIRDDFLRTQSCSTEITSADCDRISPLKRLGIQLLRLLAPLM